MHTIKDKKVLDYMSFLEDPSTAVNHAAVDRALKAFEEASDPLEKLEARQKWVDSKQPDGTKVETDFIEVAKEWAQSKNIEADTFLAQGVPREVLSAAGFEDVRTGTYKPRVKGETVREWALAQTDKYTTTDAVDALGASPAGVRNVLKSMVEAGEIVVVPGDGKGTSAGKTAIVFRTV